MFRTTFEEVSNYMSSSRCSTFSEITFEQKSDEKKLDIRVFAYEDFKKLNLMFRMEVYEELYVKKKRQRK